MNEFGIDLFFDYVELEEAMAAVQPPPTFFDDLFFGPSRYRFTTADAIAYDVKSGQRTLAPYINPRIGNKVVERGGYSTRLIQLPEIAPSMILTPEDAKKRMAGEAFNSPRNIAERLQDMQVEDVVEMRLMHRRRREQQATSLILTGKMAIKGEGIDAEMDIWADLAAADRPFTDVGAGDAQNYWDGSSANPVGDLISGRLRAAKAMGASPTMAILGSAAYAAIRDDEQWLKRLDNTGINAGFIDVAYLPNGVIRIGYLAEAGVTLYAYEGDIYDEETDTVVPIIPPNYVVLCTPQADTRRYFGQVAMVIPGAQPPRWDFRNGEYNVNTYMQVSPEQGMLTEVKAKTIPMIRQIQEFQILKVLAD